MSSGRVSSKLYELRTYSVKLPQMKMFLDGVKEQFHLRLQHSTMLGFWTSELGGLNQVVHFWEYDNLAHRASVRAKLAQDPDWAQKFVVPLVFPSISLQENSLIRTLEGTGITLPDGKGVAQLQTFSMRGPTATWRPVLQRLAATAAPPESVLIGCFQSLVGPMNDAVMLWHHPSPDALLEATEKLRSLKQYEELQEHVITSHSKMLLPHAISPIQ